MDASQNLNMKHTQNKNQKPAARFAARIARSAKLAGMMDKYLDRLNDLMDKCREEIDSKPEDLQQIDRMLRIAVDYERDQVLLEQRQRTLEIRQAEYELKVKRAAQAEKRDKEKARERKAAADRKAPRDFDNSARIAAARAAHRAQWDTPENRADVEAMLAKAEAEAGIDPDNNPNIIQPT
jgi:hypothetical protein